MFRLFPALRRVLLSLLQGRQPNYVPPPTIENLKTFSRTVSIRGPFRSREAQGEAFFQAFILGKAMRPAPLTLAFSLPFPIRLSPPAIEILFFHKALSSMTPSNQRFFPIDHSRSLRLPDCKLIEPSSTFFSPEHQPQLFCGTYL